MVRLDEQELTRVMGEAVGGVRPATHELVEGATRRGRRLKARRRVAYSAAACVLAGVVAGTSLLGSPPVSGDGMRTLPGMTDGGPGEVVFPDFSRLPDSPEVPPGKEPLTARALAMTLDQLLPQNSENAGYSAQIATNADEGKAGTGPFDGIVLRQVEPRTAGPGVGIRVHSEFHRTTDMETLFSCKAGMDKRTYVYAVRTETKSCGVRNLDDGSVLMLLESAPGSRAQHAAWRLRPDGLLIISQSTGMGSAEPPHSLAEMEQIVSSDQWQVYVDPEVNERANQLEPFHEIRGEVAPRLARTETD
ncbi:hypothetical protein [Streptomyces mesophilus]|uniref:hypothetical protein n=1 Tax=Streptomyces mesophilus TaxID=1775132 RepID=UPI0033249DE0